MAVVGTLQNQALVRAMVAKHVDQFRLEVLPNGRILVNQARVQEPFAQLFELEHYPHQRVRDGRGQAYQVRGSFGLAALRHYCRGGLFGSLLQDKYLFQGYDGTRAFRELRLLADLRARGLPVPEPLACRVLITGLIYRADLLTSWIEGAAPLSQHVKAATEADFLAVGAMLGNFFKAGLWHADLNAHNVLLTPTGPALIDFDRCEIRKNDPAGQQANIARLHRSLTKLGFAARADFTSALWPALQAGLQTGLAASI
jgi:3-deoxy-D-manno-octulosonic acid kinase